MIPLTGRARWYAVLIIVTGIALFALLLQNYPLAALPLPALVVLTVLATLARLSRVQGPVPEASYDISWFFYFASFVLLGPVGAALVILVAQVVERFFVRYPDWMLAFDLGVYMIALAASALTYPLAISAGPGNLVVMSFSLILSAALFAFIVFSLVLALVALTNHSVSEDPGVFRLADATTSVCLLAAGGAAVLLWKYEPATVIWAIIPIYLYQRALSVPRLTRLTSMDIKTGLYNAQYFRDTGQGELKRSQRFQRPLSIIMADLDLLRNVNNTYGHVAGDIVLKGVAETLRAEVRTYDIVSRFGGEEFAILLPETGARQALSLAERIRKTIGEQGFQVPTSRTPIHVTVSLGVAAFPEHGADFLHLIHEADLGLYEAKLAGRNRCQLAPLDTRPQGAQPTWLPPARIGPRELVHADPPPEASGE